MITPMTTQELTSLVIIVMNGGALVWGAATISSSVKHLDGTVGELKQLVLTTSDKLHTVIAQVAVLEAEWDGVNRRRKDDA
jgi:hypothetical protein